MRLVISPHLDDAALSVGGTIARWTAAGERVVIASVYTDAPPIAEIAPNMRKWADYPARRAEDAAACAVLGAEHRWLGQTERAFRRPFFTGMEFFTTPAERAGFTTLANVTTALAALDDLDPERVLLPIGIGGHVDHVEATLATIDWASARGWLERLTFYEDFYAFAEADLASSPRLAEIMRAIARARRGPEVHAYLPAVLERAVWTVNCSRIDEPAKLTAIARYPSQMQAFGGHAGIADALRAFHARWGGAEPLWRPGAAVA